MFTIAIDSEGGLAWEAADKYTPAPEMQRPADLGDFVPKIKKIPLEDIPEKIGSMAITPALLEDYKGHEYYLKFRARHSPECYRQFDAMRLCLIKRIADRDMCERIRDAYQPCAVELRQARINKMLQQEDERRKMLSAKARIMQLENEPAP